MYIWTASANERIYKNTRISRTSKNFLSLESAKNAYVSGQILLRDIVPFDILNVKVTGNFKCDIFYQNYNVFNDGIPYPDELLYLEHVDKLNVLPNSTQGIWLSFFIPEGEAGGSYYFNAEVETSAGKFTTPIYLHIYNVVVPDSSSSDFNLEYFFLPFDLFPYKNSSVPQDCEQYGYERYSDKWWQLMEKYADCFKQIRNNSLDIRIMNLLADAGSKEMDDNTWLFKWELFDKFVQFFIERNVVKSLSCSSIIFPVLNDTITSIDKESNTYALKIESDKGEAFANAFYSSLYEHINDLGLLDIFRMRLQDEPHQDKYWKWARLKVKELMPGVLCGEPLDTLSVAKELTGYCDQYIPRIEVYDDGADFFRDRQKEGSEVWVYSCCFPEEHWFLNKFTDHPHIHSRIMTWACYSQNITGFLHWGFNYFVKNDLYSYMPGARFKGDGHIVYPNIKHNTINLSTRFIATRDGIQDYELLKIAEKQFKDQANALGRKIARNFQEYDDNPALLDSVVSDLLKMSEISYSKVSS